MDHRSSGGIAATPNAVGIDGSVYALNSATLYAVSSSGVLEWTFSPPQGLSPANLAIARDGTIYTGDQCGLFYALNPADGTTKWTFGTYARNCNFYTPTNSPAVSEDGTIYSGVVYGSGPPSGVLFALTSGGSLIWKSTTFIGTPAIASYGILYVTSGQNFYALNTSGVLQWQVNVPYPNEFTLPAISPDGTVYVGTASTGLWAIDSLGNVTWKFNPNGNPYFLAPPTLGGDGTIYIAYDSLYAVNPGTTPTLKWSTVLCSSGGGGTATSDEPVIGLDGTIYMIADYTGTCPLEAFH